MRNKLAVFDLDGTLFDTRKVNYYAYLTAIRDSGVTETLDYKFYCDFCNGNSYKVFLPQIIPQLTEELMEQIHERKKAVYPRFLNLAVKNEHLFLMMELIREKYQVAIVTTASRKNAMDILKKFKEETCFDFMITQEDVQETKPSPECYFKAMEEASVTKSDTIIFEDSVSGLKAAGLSGANYVRVYGYS